MADLLTAAEMRSIEERAISSGRVTGRELMERAGASVVEAVFSEWPKLAQGTHRAIVLCGPGNNGGDGYVVARLLHDQGWNVEVFQLGDAQDLPPDAAANCSRWRERGEIQPIGKTDGWKLLQKKPDLIVDAVFGTGLTRPVPWEFVMISQELNLYEMDAGGVAIVAVDFPSGVNADTGNELGEALAANLTVTFHAKKVGHRIGRGKILSGKIVVKDIGL